MSDGVSVTAAAADSSSATINLTYTVDYTPPTLTAAYQAEGITPTSSALTQGVLQLHRDAGRA